MFSLWEKDAKKMLSTDTKTKITKIMESTIFASMASISSFLLKVAKNIFVFVSSVKLLSAAHVVWSADADSKICRANF